MRGYNDDLVMSMAIACWVRDTALVSNQRNTEYKKAFLGAMTTSRKTLNTSIPGMVQYGGSKYDAQKELVQEAVKNFPGLFKG